MSQLNVNTIKNRTGTSGPVLTGLSTVSGSLVVTNDATVSGSATITGALTVGGVLTYEDVTNVDSVGVVTARLGVNVTGGEIAVGAAFSVGQAGVVTATSFVGNITGTASDASGASSDFSIADKIVHTGDTNTAIRFPAADTFTVETAGSERVRITNNGRLGIGTNNPGHNLEIMGSFPDFAISDSDTTNDKFRILHNGGSTQLQVDPNNVSGSSHLLVAVDGTERLRVTSDGEVKVGVAFSVGQAGVCTASSFSDSIGDLRTIPLKTESSSASYTLIASDAGKTIHVHTTTTTVVVPNSVFSAGDAVSIVNGDGSNTPTISQGTGFSLRNTGDGTTGNRTLGVFGMATIYFTGAGVGYISGSGMT